MRVQVEVSRGKGLTYRSLQGPRKGYSIEVLLPPDVDCIKWEDALRIASEKVLEGIRPDGSVPRGRFTVRFEV